MQYHVNTWHLALVDTITPINVLDEVFPEKIFWYLFGTFSVNFQTDGIGNQYFIDIWDFIIPWKGSLSWSNLITLSVWWEEAQTIW